jgi:uncharacterized protein YbaP (TraB family)
MRRDLQSWIWGAALGLALAGSVCGGGEPNQASERTPAQGPLWQVDSATATVYLLGVIHVANDRFYPLAPAIESAFARADVLVQETKIDRESQQRLHKMIYEVGTYPPGESLEQHLSADVRALYESYLKRPYVDPNSLKRFRPWVVAWMISMNEARRLGYSYDRGVATHFLRQAEGKKEIVGLETPADYAGLFIALPDETQESMLRMTLAQVDALPETMERLTDLWRRGDWQAGEKVVLEFYGGPEMVPFYRNERNQRVTARIEEYLKTNRTYFVTVGAGHLVGKDGIVARLRRGGHTVKWLGPEKYALPQP